MLINVRIINWFKLRYQPISYHTCMNFVHNTQRKTKWKREISCRFDPFVCWSDEHLSFMFLKRSSIWEVDYRVSIKIDKSVLYSVSSLSVETSVNQKTSVAHLQWFPYKKLFMTKLSTDMKNDCRFLYDLYHNVPHHVPRERNCPSTTKPDNVYNYGDNIRVYAHRKHHRSSLFFISMTHSHRDCLVVISRTKSTILLFFEIGFLYVDNHFLRSICLQMTVRDD